MSKTFITGRRRFLAAGAAALCAGPIVSAQPGPPGAGTDVTLKKLLDDAGIPYAVRQTSRETRYEVRIETDAGTTDLTARDLTMNWMRRDGTPVRTAYLYIPAVRFPASFVPSAALLKLLADLNNDLVFGNVGIGKFGVFYSNSLWLHNADVEMLADVISMAHHQALEVRKSCQPFVRSI